MRLVRDNKDASLAAVLFGAGLLFMLLAASVGLTSWPGEQLSPVFTNPTFQNFILASGGYSFLFIGLFCASRPGRRSQLFVAGLWPCLTLALWWASRDTIRFSWSGTEGIGWITLFSVGLGLPAAGALLWRVWRPAANADVNLESSIRWLLVMMLLFTLVPMSALRLTVSLHPQTLDILAMKFDAAAGLELTPWLFDTVRAIPGASDVLGAAYGFTPFAFFALTLLQLRGHPAHLPNAILLWVGMTLCALLAYHLFPITGPKYVFGEDQFIKALREVDALPLERVSGVGPNPRNGMPSMHFGWMLAALVIWSLSNTRLWSRLALGVMTAFVAMATLYLGEHYVIDLIVAVPFVLASIALCTTRVPWSSAARWRTILLGFGCWLAWVVLLRTQIELFIAHAWLCWVLILATALVAWLQIGGLAQFRHLAEVTPASEVTAPAEPADRATARKFGIMFFASGAAALVYQVLFAKELALVFGSTSTATFTVLATFLGGMAIGSLIGGVVANRSERPVVVYALIELAIGGFCIATPALFTAIQHVYVLMAADIPPDAPSLLALRVALGAGVLLVPTILMGITLPVLAKALNGREQRLGQSVAWLYACNTAGAAVGAILTSYAIIPLLGTHSTTLLAALLNFLVALGALEIAKTFGAFESAEVEPDEMAPWSGSRRRLLGAWIALGFGGILSLGLEVIYIHLLSIVAGNSVYAFGLMLATFLVGLALGGECGRRIILSKKRESANYLILAQLLLASSIALGAWGWDMIPAYFASFSGYPLSTGFGAREMIRGLVCALVMVPPTICIGLSYALAMDMATSAGRRKGVTILGISAALNTLGNILGVLLFGFLMLPWLGGLVASKVVAAGALAVALCILFLLHRSVARSAIVAGLVAVSSLVLLSPSRLDYEMLSSGANVYFSEQRWGRIIDHAESIDGGLTTVAVAENQDGAVKTLLTNGKFQGNDAKHGEVQAQIGFAALPLLHQPGRENALVIGYGTGATSRVFHDAGFAHLDIAELSRDVVALADANFSSINGRVSQQPGVQANFTDGRNFLLLTRRQYDIISIEITSIWFAGAASLYNQEFYHLARSKLKPDGVLQQWVQLHHMAPSDLLTIIGTLRSEFEHVSLYVVGGQGILIATNDPGHAHPRPEVVVALDAAPQLQAVRELAGRGFADIAGELMLAPSQVDYLVDKIGIDRRLWVSTDRNLRLEYNTPKANAYPQVSTVDSNMALLRSAQRGDEDSVKVSQSGESRPGISSGH